MWSRNVILRAAVGALFLTAATASRNAFAQEPPSIGSLASRTTLSPAETESVRAYADHWTGRLRESAENPNETRRIRRALLEPVGRGGVTEVFLDAYGRAALPGLARCVDEGNSHQSVTALIVVSQLGTDRALDMLVDRASMENEQRAYVRLAAARGCGHLLRQGNATIAPKDIVGASRGLLSASRQEDNPFALHHQVAALLAAHDRIPVSGRPPVRSALVSAIERTAERAKAAPPDGVPIGFLNAVYPVVNQLRTRFLGLRDLAAQRDFGRALGPCLEKVLGVAEAHWADLRDGPKDRERLGNIIHLCERFLAAIDTIVRGNRPPDTRLKEAWDADDADGYRRDLDKWRDLLAKPPY